MSEESGRATQHDDGGTGRDWSTFVAVLMGFGVLLSVAVAKLGNVALGGAISTLLLAAWALYFTQSGVEVVELA